MTKILLRGVSKNEIYYLTLKKNLASETQKYYYSFPQHLSLASLRMFAPFFCVTVRILPKYTAQERSVVQTSIFPCRDPRRKKNPFSQHPDIKSMVGNPIR